MVLYFFLICFLTFLAPLCRSTLCHSDVGFGIGITLEKFTSKFFFYLMSKGLSDMSCSVKSVPYSTKIVRRPPKFVFYCQNFIFKGLVSTATNGYNNLGHVFLKKYGEMLSVR